MWQGDTGLDQRGHPFGSQLQDKVIADAHGENLAIAPEPAGLRGRSQIIWV